VFQVGARAEGLVAGAGEDEDACFVVGLEGLERVLQLLGGGTVDGISPLAAIDGYESGGAAPLVRDELAYQPVR
jgi:hypothetical protein